MNTFRPAVSNDRPTTNTTSKPNTSGSQSQCTFAPNPKAITKASSSAIWMRRCRQQESTVQIGITSRGTGTRLIRLALSSTDPVPELQAIEKKLNGSRPQNKNTGKCGSGFLKILVKTNVSTVIMTMGFTRLQSTPSDMLRYRTLKSFITSLRIRKR